MARIGLIRKIIAYFRDFLGGRYYYDEPAPRQLTVHHEAGHAVAAVFLGIGFARVSVVDDRAALGRIVLDQVPPHRRPGFDPKDPENRRIAQDWILLALAGEFADAYHGGRNAGRTRGALWDFRVGEELAKLLFVDPGECDDFLKEMRSRAQRFVSDPLRWRQISAVATRLDQLRELDQRQVGQIMDEIAAAGDSGGADDRNRDAANP